MMNYLWLAESNQPLHGSPLHRLQAAVGVETLPKEVVPRPKKSRMGTIYLG